MPQLFGSPTSDDIACVRDDNTVWLTRYPQFDTATCVLAERRGRSLFVDLSPYGGQIAISSNTDSTSWLYVVTYGQSGCRTVATHHNAAEPVFNCIWLSATSLVVVYTNGASYQVDTVTAQVSKRSGRGYALGWADVQRGGGLLLKRARDGYQFDRLSPGGDVIATWRPPDSYVFHLAMSDDWVYWTGYAKVEVMRCTRDGEDLNCVWRTASDDERIFSIDYLSSLDVIAVCTQMESGEGDARLVLLGARNGQVVSETSFARERVPMRAILQGELLISETGYWRLAPTPVWHSKDVSGWPPPSVVSG